MSLHDTTNILTQREKKALDKSWAKDFAERIFPLINEKRYSVLYSEGAASRPNTPVNVIIGALVLKELFGMTDDETIESLMFDIRFQYALHTTSFEEQPLSDRSLSRFRLRCYEHETASGEDLIRETVKELSGEMAAIMKINQQMKRMDSLMVAANIKKLSRLELLYTCVSNLVTRLHKLGKDELLAGLENYHDPSDYNRVIYHTRSLDTGTRIGQVISDASKIIETCKNRGGFDGMGEFRLLLRAMDEQTIQEGDGSVRLRAKEDGGMHSGMLQNPSDPDATYREKNGKQHRGYVANIVESGENGNTLITDYRYEQNTYSDSRFLGEALDSMGKQDEELAIAIDGTYNTPDNQTKAEENNVRLIATGLSGRKANDVFADFKFSEDGHAVLECAAGIAPKSCSHIESSGQCRISFHVDNCANCMRKDECKPKMQKRTAVIFVSEKTSERAKAQREMKTGEHQELLNYRNGVESVPSVLRRKYNVDEMPVRGKKRTGLFFGFKIFATNFRKLLKHLNNLPDIPANALPI